MGDLFKEAKKRFSEFTHDKEDEPVNYPLWYVEHHNFALEGWQTNSGGIIIVQYWGNGSFMTYKQY